MTRFHSIEIADVRRETADSVSLDLKVPDDLKAEFAFEPGQYLTLQADIDGETVRRSYSICSGVDDGELRVAIKKVDGGKFSTFAAEHLEAGARIDAMPPEGRFTAPLRAGAAGHLVLFAAGSGITPVLSIIRSVLARAPEARITLFYGNRTTQSIMFREALEDLKDRHLGRLSVFHVLSRESQDIDILNGRLDAEKIALLGRTMVRPAEVDGYFLCGPYGMVEDGRAALLAAGAKPETVRVELFSTNGVAPKAPPRPVEHAHHDGAAQVDCVLDGITYRVEVDAARRVVDAAHEQGVALPYSCKGGMCCTCRCKVVDGKVAMDVNYSLEPWELDAGYVLACQSRPQTPKVRLDFDAA